MRKLLHVGIFLLPFAFSGCYFSVNAAMCDQIRSDPHQLVPQECRNYNEKDADKSSRLKLENNDSEIIKFTPSQEK